MSRGPDRSEPSDDAINDPDVLWAVIEGLLARLATLSNGLAGEPDPIVLVTDGDSTYHRHAKCPMLTELAERRSSGRRAPVAVRRLPCSAAARAGLTACRACRGHRPARRAGTESDG